LLAATTVLATLSALTALLSALSGLRRLLAGLLVRVLLAAALLTTLTALLAALVLILLIHWKVPLGFWRGNVVQRGDADPCSCRTTRCLSRANLTSSVCGLELRVAEVR